MHQTSEIQQAHAFIRQHTQTKPTIGIILGSGLGAFANNLKNPTRIAYEKIPFFAQSAAIGHDNELIIGEIANKTVVAMKGRFHYYEGFSLNQVTFPIRMMKALGIEKLIITNACGAVNTSSQAGDLMLITDHINLTVNNPLMGPNNSELGVRFLYLSEVYSKKLRAIVKEVAKTNSIKRQEGVYAWWTGPSYETPAEVRMIRTLGAIKVGMSTVPEAIIAHAAIETIGISCLTNIACGILDQPLGHEEVIETAARVKSTFLILITQSIAKF